MLLVGARIYPRFDLATELAPLKRIELKAPISEVIIHTTSAGFEVSKTEREAFPSGVPPSELTIVPAILNFASELRFDRRAGSVAGRNRTRVQQGKPKEWNRESHRSCKPDIVLARGNQRQSQMLFLA